jgi:hypothetical protein
MASISTNGNGLHVIQFLFAGKRHTVSLGKIKPDKADAIKAKIEFILQDKENGQAHETDTQKWIRSIGDKLHGKLANIGLFAPRASAKQTTLGAWIDRCIIRSSVAQTDRHRLGAWPHSSYQPQDRASSRQGHAGYAAVPRTA